jgi:hypothetical protein
MRTGCPGRVVANASQNRDKRFPSIAHVPPLPRWRRAFTPLPPQAVDLPPSLLDSAGCRRGWLAGSPSTCDSPQTPCADLPHRCTTWTQSSARLTDVPDRNRPRTSPRFPTCQKPHDARGQSEVQDGRTLRDSTTTPSIPIDESSLLRRIHSYVLAELHPKGRSINYIVQHLQETTSDGDNNINAKVSHILWVGRQWNALFVLYDSIARELSMGKPGFWPHGIICLLGAEYP